MHTKLVSWLQYIVILSHPRIICLALTTFGRLQISVIVDFLDWGLLSWFRQRRLYSTLAFGVATFSIHEILSMVESMSVLLLLDHVNIIILMLLMKRLPESSKILKKWVHWQLCYLESIPHLKFYLLILVVLVLLLLEKWVLAHHLLLIRNLSEVAFTHHIRITMHLVCHRHDVPWSWRRTSRSLWLRIWAITVRSRAWFRTRLTLLLMRVFELTLHSYHFDSAKIITISFYGIIVIKNVSRMFFIRWYKIV